MPLLTLGVFILALVCAHMRESPIFFRSLLRTDPRPANEVRTRPRQPVPLFLARQWAAVQSLVSRGPAPNNGLLP